MSQWLKHLPQKPEAPAMEGRRDRQEHLQKPGFHSSEDTLASDKAERPESTGRACLSTSTNVLGGVHTPPHPHATETYIN